MTSFKPLDYANARDAAFIAFVEDDNWEHIDNLLEQFDCPKIPHTDTGAAGVYKAIQECTRIPAEVKAKAMHKCTSLGFVPFMELGGNND